MPEDLSIHLESLQKLAPEARARVSEALKANIAAELSSQPGRPEEMRAEFSKGAFFSRSRGNAMLDETAIMEKAANMDAATFAQFAKNLQTMKGLRGSGNQ